MVVVSGIHIAAVSVWTVWHYDLLTYLLVSATCAVQYELLRNDPSVKDVTSLTSLVSHTYSHGLHEATVKFINWHASCLLYPLARLRRSCPWEGKKKMKNVVWRRTPGWLDDRVHPSRHTSEQNALMAYRSCSNTPQTNNEQKHKSNVLLFRGLKFTTRMKLNKKWCSVALNCINITAKQSKDV